ncbi:hypothetical protein [Pedobacter polysacchareus]|uniref:hypothetical protein n=1 Tax=Pedobacter polysacchareus TaxID=2861973 RepID=UPI001C99D216|nr:hypothetical protein [Pedobacter polysacchareus]
MKFTKILFAASLLLSMELSAQKIATIVSDTYNKKLDQTTLVLIPYGNVTFQGKWKKFRSDESSKQYFFRDQDSTVLSIAKVPQKDYPFYEQGLDDKSFPLAIYNWEKDYMTKYGKVQPKLITDQSDQGYVLWQVEAKDVHTILLNGSRNEYAYNFSISSKKWSDERKIGFLTEIFKQN